MRKILLPALALCLVIYSCENKSTQQENIVDTTAIETPEAFEEKTSGSYSKGKRSGDLVEELYEEFMDKNPKFLELDDAIRNVKRMSEDSSEAFNLYDRRNNNYYVSANSHLAMISDSVTRTSVREMIEKSIVTYNTRTAAIENLLAQLNQKNISVHDLYTVLKLAKTLEMIHKYQQANLPSTAPIEKVNTEYDKVIRRIKEATNK